MARILIAPNAYKGTFSPLEVCLAIKVGVEEFFFVSRASAQIVCAPLADGGDGTIEALHAAIGGIIHPVLVEGAFGEPRNAVWLESGNLAVAELASACGLAGLEPPLRPLEASTRGLGQVLASIIALRKFAEIIIAVGGSASTDGGSGALVALGGRFFSDEGELPIKGGGSLSLISGCDLSSFSALRQQCRFKVATDVLSPLCGPLGAARVFGPQKGASPAEVEILEGALAHFADVLEIESLQSGARDTPGAGAAGGTAFGLSCALQAVIVPGFPWIAELVGLSEKISACDLVITGEGCVDKSTMYGKTVARLRHQCLVENKALLVVAGSLGDDIDELQGVHVQPACTGGRFASLEDISAATVDGLKCMYKLSSS